LGKSFWRVFLIICYFEDLGAVVNEVEARRDVVILIHGIRDHARWSAEIRNTLAAAGFVTEPTNYGRFGLWDFFSPFGGGRRRAQEELSQQLSMVFERYPDRRISVIAHSFGSYLLTRIMAQNPQLKFERVISCGSVVKRTTNFRAIASSFQGSAPAGTLDRNILNEVGDSDPWPAIAESLTFIYGAAGTRGLRKPFITDRYFAEAGHGFYLNSAFCKKYWVPYLRSGKVVASPIEKGIPAWWVNLLGILPPKIIVPLLVLALVALWFVPRPPPPVPDNGFAFYETDGSTTLPESGRLLQPDRTMPPIAEIEPGSVLRAGDSIRVRDKPTSTDSQVLFVVPADDCLQVTGPIAAKFGQFGGWLPVTKSECPLPPPPIPVPPPDNGWAWVGYLDPANPQLWATGPFVEVIQVSEAADRPYPIRTGDIVRPLKELDQVIVDWATKKAENVLIPPPKLTFAIDPEDDFTGKKLMPSSTFLVMDVQVWRAGNGDPVVWLRLVPGEPKPIPIPIPVPADYCDGIDITIKPDSAINDAIWCGGPGATMSTAMQAVTPGLSTPSCREYATRDFATLSQNLLYLSAVQLAGEGKYDEAFERIHACQCHNAASQQRVTAAKKEIVCYLRSQ
jgi:pimeloyl-ACP methyl ester carboxylesterase